MVLAFGLLNVRRAGDKVAKEELLAIGRKTHKKNPNSCFNKSEVKHEIFDAGS